MNLTNPTYRTLANGRVNVKHTCIESGCTKVTSAIVAQEQIDEWKAGAHPHIAFPHLNATMWEALFMTGICGSCWDKMFPEEEEEYDANEPEYYDPSWDYPQYDPQTDFYERTGRMQFPNEY